MINTALKDLHYVEWFVLRWIIYTTLNNFLITSKIGASSKDLYSIDRFVLRWMIRSEMDDLYNVESFGDYDELLSIGFLMSARCAYLKKNTVRYFALTSELVFSWFESIKKKYFRLCPRNWSYRWRSTFLHDVRCCTTAPFVSKSQGKTKNVSWSKNGKVENEKSLLINEWTGKIESFELINVALSKNNCGRVLFQKTFTSFRNDTFPEIDSIAVAKICRNLLIFLKHLFRKSMHLRDHFPTR